MSRGAERWVLPGILAVAAWIRLWGITWGLPYPYHPDEGSILFHALGFGMGDLNPHWFRWPSLFMYVMFAVYVAYYVLGRAAGTFSAPPDLVRSYLEDPTPFWLLGRLMSAAAGVATVWITYLIARRVFGRAAGLIAAAFSAVVFLHVRDSHYATPDVVATLLATVSLLFAVRACESGAGRHLVASCLFAGLAASAKYPGILAGTASVAALVSMAVMRRAALWMVPAGVAAAVFGFVAGTPYSVLSPAEFARDIAMQFTMVSETGASSSSFSASGLQEMFVKTLGRGVGWVVLALAVAGVLLPALRRGGDSPRDPGRPAPTAHHGSAAAQRIVLVSYVLCVLAVMSLITVKRSTYLTPILPPIAVLASLPLARMFGAGGARARPGSGAAAWAALVLAIAVTATPAIRFDAALGAVDTRTQAKIWVERNLPAGSRIAVEDYGPVLNPTEAQLTEALEIDTTRVGSWRAAKRGLNLMRLEVGRTRRPQFEILRIGGGSGPFQLPDPMKQAGELAAEIVSREVRYVILSSKAQLARPMEGAEPPAWSADQSFAEWLRAHSERIARISQDRPVPVIDRGHGRSFHSPVIEIFEVVAPSGGRRGTR